MSIHYALANHNWHYNYCRHYNYCTTVTVLSRCLWQSRTLIYRRDLSFFPIQCTEYTPTKEKAMNLNRKVLYKMIRIEWEILDILYEWKFMPTFGVVALRRNPLTLYILIIGVHLYCRHYNYCTTVTVLRRYMEL
jgi:hypothetical protein